MKVFPKETIEAVYDMFFIKGYKYKKVCKKLDITFFQLEKTCYKLAVCNFSKVNTHFGKEFKKRFNIELYPYKFNMTGKRESFQFFDFNKPIEYIYNNQRMILSRYKDILDTKNKMEGIVLKCLSKGMEGKEISNKYCVSEYFVSIIKNKKPKKKKNQGIKMLSKKNQALQILNGWFVGRTLTNETKKLFTTLGILDLVLNNQIQEAIDKIS